VKVLPDTSIWVDYLREGVSGAAAALEGHLQEESVLVCGPVLAELLAGTPPERRDDLWLALGSLPWAELDHAAWRRASEVANDLRRTGRSVPLTDVVIAVACTRADASLWTRDRDFEAIGAVLPELEVYAP
jgi:predicted nucleic acid-binding protein